MNPQNGDETPKTDIGDKLSSSNIQTTNKDSGPENTLEGSSDNTQNTLEGSSDNNQKTSQPEQNNNNDNKPVDSESPKKGPLHKIISLFRKFDIYFLIFIFLIVVAVIVAYVAVQKNKTAKQQNISSQTLDQNALKQISGNDISVGGTNQTLDIQSNAIFGSNVLVKSDLQVAGTLKVAGSLDLTGITISGTTNLGQVNASTLNLTGDETVKGQLTVNQGLNVDGNASFGGVLSASSINVSNLTVNGDISFAHHLYSVGSIPRVSYDSAIGSGGTTSINGSDTAGNVNVNTGSGASAGCLVDITFAQTYTETPYIEITPVGSAAGSNIGFYITRSTSGFSICATSPPSDAAMSFDYYVIG
jgi:cytoskeletal protein CcmA (bactofilin family)